MALDIRNNDGDLDRGKVNSRLADLMARLQPRPFPSSIVEVSDGIMDLIDAAVNQAQVDTENWCRNG